MASNLKTQFWLLVENLESVVEGLEIVVMFVVGGVVLGIAWAWREIVDSRTLR